MTAVTPCPKFPPYIATLLILSWAELSSTFVRLFPPLLITVMVKLMVSPTLAVWLLAVSCSWICAPDSLDVVLDDDVGNGEGTGILVGGTLVGGTGVLVGGTLVGGTGVLVGGTFVGTGVSGGGTGVSGGGT